MYIDNEREVVALTTESNEANAHPAVIEHDADAETRTYERNLRFENYYERGVLFAGFILTIITVLTGTFVGRDALLSWVWAIPLILVIACIIAKRFAFLLVPLVLFLGLLILIFSSIIFFGFNIPMYLWAFVAGNETLNQPGLWNGVARGLEIVPGVGGLLGGLMTLIGLLLNLALAFVLPAWLVYQLARRIFDHESSLGRTLGLTLLTVACFIAPIGWAIIMNFGY